MRKTFIYLILALSGIQLSTLSGQCVADFSFDATSTNVRFFDESSSPIVGIAEHHWEFGDGAISTLSNPNHIYPEAKHYDVTLTIITPIGCESSITKTINICDIRFDLDSDISCDDDYNTTINLNIVDGLGNAQPLDILVDGNPVNELPLFTMDNIVNFELEVPSDGLAREIKAQSIANPGCNQSIDFISPACVVPCVMSNLEARIISNQNFTAILTPTGYQPASLNIQTGDVVNFLWEVDQKSVTTVPNNNPQSWNSGLLNNGDSYEVYSFAPGIYNYISNNDSDQLFTGSLVSTCPDSAYYDLLLTFESNGQEGEYDLWIDGVPSTYQGIAYSTTGVDSLIIPISGDGVDHNYEIVTASSPSCRILSNFQSPICGVTPACNIDLSAIQTSVCDKDSVVQIAITVLSAFGGQAGYSLFIDEQLIDHNISYGNTEEIINRKLKGDGAVHTIRITDNLNEECSASTTISLEDCSIPCEFSNFFAGIGSSNVLIANVTDNAFQPVDITISAGDRVNWQWLTDSMRSVTASDFTFDSGVMSGFGKSYLSPFLEVGVHRYFSDINGMQGSITVNPDCVDGQVPVIYSFDKSGGAQNGYDVYIDEVKINNTLINYTASGFNTQSNMILGDGQIHTLRVVDDIDTSCSALASFEVPTCDESTCAIYIDSPISEVCLMDNRVVSTFPIQSFNSTSEFYQISIDGMIIDTLSYGINGDTGLTLTLLGNNDTYNIEIQDLNNVECYNNITYQTPLCTAPCSFDNLEINYRQESLLDSCFDGRIILDMSFDAIHSFNSNFIARLITPAMTTRDTIDYQEQNSFELSYDLLASGSTVTFTLYNEMNEGCRKDTSFNLINCDIDPCTIALTGIDYGPCQDGGLMDMIVTLDTIRVSDSLSISLSDSLIYMGPYIDFANDTSFTISHQDTPRTLMLTDLSVEGCEYEYSINTPFCPIECDINLSYEQRDSCILATAEFYQVILTVDVLNKASDSIRVFYLNEILETSYEQAQEGITLTLPIGDHSILVTDKNDEDCSASIVVSAPDCTLECGIEIVSISTEVVDQEIVYITDSGFMPDTSHVVLGDTILFINVSNATEAVGNSLDVLSGGFNSGFITVGDTFQVVTNKIGEIQFSALLSGSGDMINRGILNVQATCTNGQTEAIIEIASEYPTSDSIEVQIDDEPSFKLPYPSNGLIYTTIDGDGSEHTINVNDIADVNCLGTTTIISPLCEFTCSDFTVGFNMTIDTLTRTVNLAETATGGDDRWNWDFGDDQASVIRNPSHTFDDYGTYTICLLATNSIENCFEESCQTIDIVDIDCQAIADIQVDAQNITFISNSVISNGTYAYLWTLDDQPISNTTEGTFESDTVGTLNICLEIIGSTGCSDIVCESIFLEEACNIVPSYNFTTNNDTLSLSNTGTGTYDSISWDLGDGITTTGSSVFYVYDENGAYNVCLTLVNTTLIDCEAVICQSIDIQSCRADASFEYDLDLDSLSAQMVNINEGDIFSWDFGNGFNSSNNPVTFVYTTEGMYDLCATVSSSSITDCTDTQCEEINVVFTDVNQVLQDATLLYPNPIKQGDFINIEHPNANQLGYQLYDQNGRKILTEVNQNGSNIQISTNHLAEGNYILKIWNGAAEVSRSIVIF